MKKLLFLLSAVLLLSLKSFAQNEVKLTFRYLPERNYLLNTTTSLLSTIRFTGSAKELARLKAQGVKQPMTVSVTMDGKAHINTGKQDSASQRVPLQMKYDKLLTQQSFNGQQMSQPNPIEGKVFYGNIISGKMHIDSIAGMQLPDSTLSVLTKTMNGLLSQIQFPEKSMKVGESFTQSTPVNIAIPGAAQGMKMDMSNTYKLIQVTNGKAYFDVIQKIAYHFTISGHSLTATGSGSGKLVYSVADQVIDNFHTTYDINMHMQMSKTGAMNAAMHANTSLSMQISK